jgi:hypothetical protein
MRRTDLRFKSRASERSSITQGRFVVFTLPSMTGPATSKHAVVTDIFTWERNCVTISCRLG